MNKHLVVIFAYHFPPENAVGGARPFRFSKYLSKLGYHCRVFTASEQAGREDPNTEFIADPFRTYSWHKLSWQVERAVRKFFLPGEAGTQWSYRASRAASTFLRANPYTIVTILSTFPPLGPHLAAWQLARSENLPWIADFRDPMRNERAGEFVNILQRKVDRWLEVILTRRADALIANTDSAVLRWRKEFPSQDRKYHLIWNGFDPEERCGPLPTASGNRRVLSHVGELYGGRTANPILESIERLIIAGRVQAGSVGVRLIGPAEAGTLPNQEFLNRARAQGWLELVTDQIPKKEALQIARSSHYLLLLQLRSSIHVPAKIFEYLQFGRPILAFIPRESPGERLLEKSGIPYRCVYPGSTQEVIDKTVIEFFNLPSVAVPASPWFEEHFNAENQTRQLDNIICSLRQKPTRGPGGLSRPTPGTEA
jgi:glycosyltransferase involved in cell wall biosynthesis